MGWSRSIVNSMRRSKRHRTESSLAECAPYVPSLLNRLLFIGAERTARFPVDHSSGETYLRRCAIRFRNRLDVSFQEVVHSVLTEEAEVSEASDSEDACEYY